MKSYRLKPSLFIAVAIAAAIPLGAQTVAITGGKVYPVSGPPIEGGTVVIVTGKISAVGSGITIPEGAQRIDATGKILTPGFVNAATQSGVQEVAAVNNTRDASARGQDTGGPVRRGGYGPEPERLHEGSTAESHGGDSTASQRGSPDFLHGFGRASGP